MRKNNEEKLLNEISHIHKIYLKKRKDLFTKYIHLKKIKCEIEFHEKITNNFEMNKIIAPRGN